MSFLQRLLRWLPFAVAGCAQQATDSDNTAHLVLTDVAWAFTGETYGSVDEFRDAVNGYQEEVKNKTAWQPDSVAVDAPRLHVCYLYWEADEQLEGTAELQADDGQEFSAVELLFKLHNSVVERLSDDDNVFFEGLILRPATDQTPATATLRLGS